MESNYSYKSVWILLSLSILLFAYLPLFYLQVYTFISMCPFICLSISPYTKTIAYLSKGFQEQSWLHVAPVLVISWDNWLWKCLLDKVPSCNFHSNNRLTYKQMVQMEWTVLSWPTHAIWFKLFAVYMILHQSKIS